GLLQGQDRAQDGVVGYHRAEALAGVEVAGLEAQAAGALGAAQLQPVRPLQRDPGGDLPGAGGLHQLVEEAADLPCVAAGLGTALLAVVEFLDHLHRQVDVVLLELEQRRGVVHQHVGVEHVDPLASGHGGASGQGCWRAFNSSSTAWAWPGTFTGCQRWATRPSGSIRKVLRTMPITFRPYMFFSAITPKALQTVSSLSATSSNRKPCLARKLEWVFAESRETPRISAPSAWNSGSSASKSRPSVVQPGVWSFG